MCVCLCMCSVYVCMYACVCACMYICSRVCLCLYEYVYEHMIQVHVEDREQLAGVCSCWVKSAPHQTLQMADSIVDCRLCSMRAGL